MKISVSYDETDVAKALSKIIKDPNQEELVKLFTPIISGNSQIVEYFFKLLIGNKLPDVIPNGTLCRLDVADIGYGMNREATKQKYADQDDKIIVTIVNFRGYHEYSDYTIEYTGITNSGDIRKDTTYASSRNLEVIEEF